MPVHYLRWWVGVEPTNHTGNTLAQLSICTWPTSRHTSNDHHRHPVIRTGRWPNTRTTFTSPPFQKAIVPMGRPRPYSIIILNMRFIPKASLRASSQITASSYILERHLWVHNSKHFALAPTWSLACKQTDCITAGIWKLLDPKSLYWHSVNTKHLYDFMQCWTNVENVGPTLYKCYTNVLCLLGCRRTFSQTLYIYLMLV